MRFSIVIPTYNSKRSLKNTLESLNYQTGYGHDDFEVIVSDDGSNDDTFEYIRDTPHHYVMNYIYLDRCKESCRSRTRNEGRKAANGEIILYLDSDMVVKKDFLSEVDRYFSVSDRFVLMGTRLMIDEPIRFDEIANQTVFDRYPFNQYNFKILEYRHYLYGLHSYNAHAIVIPWMQLYSCIIAVAKKWLDDIHEFDINLPFWGMEDLEFGYLLYKKGLLLAINPKMESLHQNHGARNDLIVELSKVKEYETNIDYFLKKHPDALGGVRPSIAHKFLKGEIPLNKLTLKIPQTDIHLYYMRGMDIETLKDEILQYAYSPGFTIIIDDFKEDDNLDIWIQLLGKTRSTIRYFPQSKKVDVNALGTYIDEERKRQRNRDQSIIIS